MWQSFVVVVFFIIIIIQWHELRGKVLLLLCFVVFVFFHYPVAWNISITCSFLEQRTMGWGLRFWEPQQGYPMPSFCLTAGSRESQCWSSETVSSETHSGHYNYSPHSTSAAQEIPETRPSCGAPDGILTSSPLAHMGISPGTLRKRAVREASWF